ncbi:MAG: ISKra4 family transposase [Gammaproteobacteria bacterium]|nr:ISKra4 family transposase [Gammaproteobacteria bacterium]
MEKKLWWRTTFGKIHVEEQRFLVGGRTVRPFSKAAKVRHRGLSMPLQRAVVDFGADKAYSHVPKKLKEHYGITIPISAARQITMRHGEQMAAGEPQTVWPRHPGVATVVAQADGAMIPVVEIPPAQQGEHADGRRRRVVGWKDGRLSLAYEEGKAQPVFAATMGSPDEVGDGLLGCALRVGLGQRSSVHCVADGAPWIALQMDRVFGAQGTFLIDFYHLCEYFTAAAPSCAPEDPDAWIKTQARRMKANQVDEVLSSLRPYREPDSVENKNAPVRKAYRYIHNRLGQFRYKEALEADLPIGSGEIESAHRYITQARLKIAGAWWKPDNAQRMLDLRVNRANDDWDDYWAAQYKHVA